MKLKDWSALTLLAAIWGASFLFIRITTPDFGAIPVVAGRVLAGAIFLLVITYFRQALKWPAKDIIPLALLGLIGSALPFWFYSVASYQVSASLMSIINATAPFYGILVGSFIHQSVPPKQQVSGLVLGILGVGVLVFNPNILSSASSWALGAALAAPLCYGVASQLTHHRLKNVPSILQATLAMCFAAFWTLPLAIPELDKIQFSWNGFSALLMLGIVCTGTAYLLYFRLIQTVGPVSALSVTYLIPLFGVFWGWLFLDESLDIQSYLGGLIILSGVFLTNRRTASFKAQNEKEAAS